MSIPVGSPCCPRLPKKLITGFLFLWSSPREKLLTELPLTPKERYTLWRVLSSDSLKVSLERTKINSLFPVKLMGRWSQSEQVRAVGMKWALPGNVISHQPLPSGSSVRHPAPHHRHRPGLEKRQLGMVSRMRGLYNTKLLMLEGLGYVASPSVGGGEGNACTWAMRVSVIWTLPLLLENTVSLNAAQRLQWLEVCLRIPMTSPSIFLAFSLPWHLGRTRRTQVQHCSSTSRS